MNDAAVYLFAQERLLHVSSLTQPSHVCLFSETEFDGEEKERHFHAWTTVKEWLACIDTGSMHPSIIYTGRNTL